MEIPEKKRFKNLDGLRFIAAFFVIIGHCQHVLIEKGRAAFGNTYTVYSPFADKLANFGVDFFYVLSGFLISYLLIVEIEQNKSIDIRRFYIRRGLRIWPLYFAFGLTGLIFGKFFTNWLDYYAEIPYTIKDFGSNLFFLTTFSINIQTLIGYQTPVSSLMVGHFWSLGIEEQFYLIWAPAMYLFRKNIWIIIIIFITIGLICNQIPPESVNQYFHYFFTPNRFYHFGIGAALAYGIRLFQNDATKIITQKYRDYFEKKFSSVTHLISTNYFKFSFSIALQLIFLVPTCQYLFGNFHYTTFERTAHGYISVGIICVAITKFSVFECLFLESKAIKYLGKISFGIYIFHLITIYICFKLLTNCGFYPFTTLFYWLLPLCSTVLTVLLSAISYQFFELYFLRKKEKM